MSHEVFWRSKSLEEMSQKEWESLCDGCALCCLHKVQDDETEQVYYTSVVCHLLDLETCMCTKYEERCSLVPECLKLRPEDVSEFHWLPQTCAYRLVHEGRDLFPWHPLISGDPKSVMKQGASVVDWWEVKDNEITEEEFLDYIIE